MSNIKILYAEDEVYLGKIVKETLETRGFTVVMEQDGAGVIPALEQEKPDVCVLDIMLPNRNGFELAAEIRARGWDVPVIFLTAKGQTEDVVNGFRIGGNDYIRKPFSMEELIVRIENVLRVKREDAAVKPPDVLVMGHYRLQVNKQLLCREEEEKRLSYRETELLKYLWVHRNTIIDRAGLLNEIWGNDSFFNSRNLDVYITKLRSYLKDDPRLEIITVKGVGYRFITE